MSGRIKHEVNVRPNYNEKYSNRMRARHEAASEPTRQIKMIEDSHPGGRGNINMLSSGADQRTGAFDSLVVCLGFVSECSPTCSHFSVLRGQAAIPGNKWKGLPVCRKINYSTLSLHSSVTRSTGASKSCA